MLRHVLLATVASLPALAAEPLCAVPGGAAPPWLAAPVATAPLAPPRSPTSVPTELAALSFARHVAASGATLHDLGEAHGMRGVAARSGEEFMLFQVAPGGEAAVAGAIALMSPAQLASIAPGGVTDLGEAHGLRGLFVRSGPQFQVFYVTPDGQRVIPGVLWGADGRDLTRAQVASIPGVVPTVVLGDVRGGGAPATNPAALPVVARAHAGLVGAEGAPLVWMLADPRCTYSVRAMQVLQPLVSAGRVRVAVVPVAVLDREAGGASARAAAAMLAEPAEGVAAWQANRLTAVALTPEASSRLRENMAIADAIGLRGTPTFVFRRQDGSEGRVDGLPDDVGALVASLGR